MKIPHGKTVALINPLWIGHHPMYFNQFITSFLRCGARVIGLCPQPEAAFANLKRSVDPQTAAEYCDRVHFAELPAGKRSFFNGRFEGDPVRTLSRWRKAATVLGQAEEDSGLHADLVFFPHLDSYLRFLPVPIIPDVLLGRPWGGLYLRNHHHGEAPSLKKSLRLLAKGDALMRSEHCLGVGVLDERFLSAMERYSGKNITQYPDITQGGLPEEPFPVAVDIQRKAAGRRIIGMIGLERRKGFLTLLRCAALARREGLPCYFVCTGAIHLDEYSDSERREIDATLQGIASGGIHNLYLDPSTGRIDNETDYNSVFSTFDIAWVAYEGFPGSSGTLGKAAMFEIPCLATAGECIGLRVESYPLGITIPQATPELALSAIKRIIDRNDADGRPLTLNFAEYREDHSQARLDRILADLLVSI